MSNTGSTAPKLLILIISVTIDNKGIFPTRQSPSPDIINVFHWLIMAQKSRALGGYANQIIDIAEKLQTALLSGLCPNPTAPLLRLSEGLCAAPHHGRVQPTCLTSIFKKPSASCSGMMRRRVRAEGECSEALIPTWTSGSLQLT